MDEVCETEAPAIYSPRWVDDCSTCKAIWHLFADPENAPRVHLGTYEKALSTTCPNHRPLVQNFVDFLNSEEDLNEDDEIGFSPPPKGASVVITQSFSDGGYVRHLLLVERDNVDNHPGIGRLLNPDFADLETVKKWKHRCVSSHGPKCDNPLKVWSVRPAWLIDVQNQCIVPGHTTGNYVAISYTYGEYTRPSISLSDFNRLQEPFALTTPEFSNLISPMIRHAMRMTTILEERFLWADSLCITHHDPKTASEQLKLMGAIYANAIVTIIAADGDSESGLSGLRGTSGPRETSQDIIPFGDETIVVRNTYCLDEMIYFSSRYQPYYHRGWTFQEYALSKRKIIFYNDELHWVCACSVWHEELALYTEINDEVRSWSDAVMAGFPHEFSTSRYLMTYNQRLLTFEEDALPAVSGLLSVFSRSFDGGFLYGIPEMFFEHSLGWRLWVGNLQRRLPSGRPIESQFPSSGLPSWSWLGWKGAVILRCQSAIQVTRSDSIQEAFPITEWYTSDLPSGPPEQRRRIQSTWYEKRKGYKDFSKPMPSGWTRRDVTIDSSTCNKPRVYPEGCDGYVFQHESMLEMNGEPLEWYYPFPISSIQESTGPSMPEQTRYLFCETATATLHGFREDVVELPNTRSLEASIFNSYGTKIGTLDLVNEESRDRFPMHADGSEAGLSVDIVAVCKLKTYFKIWNPGSMACSNSQTEDTYLVLWVEWEDGIAYRVASGEAIAEEWEKLDLKTVSLVLG
ncbi:heterokaryon incompatibility protein-domain-containing protein [Fusarium flagelliforme]|uniref:heterokaryon incompatibility protein-domain-containing protein n=1 Tax=Fusarium flagelliforme TaxID=2675880 RepID=UPI001E8E725E|nr:heterokaryon incompatibility protein-domain-containing protein [Fusarium flagelliforme]KAH7186267.1 heterokaryon incompatibility protein-domain-containing protein [Fusarium flagelliforme]